MFGHTAADWNINCDHLTTRARCHSLRVSWPRVFACVIAAFIAVFTQSSSLFTDCNFVFQGASVCPRLRDDASVWPRVWLRPKADHLFQPSSCSKPKPHPQLSHSVEVLLQRQLWLEGVLWGEPLSAFMCTCTCVCVCVFFVRMHALNMRPDTLTLPTAVNCVVSLIESI